MEATINTTLHRSLRVLHAVLLIAAVPLFLGALLSDLAYASSYQVQWTNLASWLIAGALVFTGLALAWTFVGALRTRSSRRQGKWTDVVLLAATFGLGFLNALIHAKDAWAAMPGGLVLSVIVFFLAIAAIWKAYPVDESRVST